MLTQEEKLDILREFPNIKLSYEKIIHKKVYNFDLLLTIPEGKKCFAWFTTFKNNMVCILLEVDNRSKKEFINIKSVQNPAKKDNTSAAKLFYAVYDKENTSVPLYKWEIRWKGDIFVSPQILTFKWNPEKDHLKIIKALK